MSVKYYKYQFNSGFRRYYALRNGVVYDINCDRRPTIIQEQDLKSLVELYPEYWSEVSALEVLVVCGRVLNE